MELALKIFQFILSISILVFLHELGHFLPAQWFKTRAEKFFLFFDPWFSIFSMKNINGKWQYKFFSKNQPDTKTIIVNGEKKEVPIPIDELPEHDWRRYPDHTKWGIGWLPMGGYVKIAGMVDESMDTEQLKKPAQPWEFRSKPAWQRLIIMAGGVTVNFFLAWIIFSSLSYFNGEKYVDLTKFNDGISASESAKKMGFEDGDHILKVDGKAVRRLENTMLDILFSDEATVLRNGKEVTFRINEEGVAEVIKQRETHLYLLPRVEGVVVGEEFPQDSPAQKSGIKSGDKILTINGQKVQYFKDLTELLRPYASNTVDIAVERNGQMVEIKSVPVNSEGKIGIPVSSGISDIEKYQTEEKYSLLSSIPRGFERTIASLTTQVKQFKIIFNSKTQGYKNVGGPIAIVKMMPVEKRKNENGEETMGINWAAFWSFTAMFSVWLAFLNLIPIPGLDGGHIMFTLWELVTGKPVPQKVLENAQMIGVIFLLGLMLLVFGNDIVKLFLGKL